MNILVTGGCGYIGSATARFLRDAGHQVSVVDNLSEGHRQAWDGDFEQLELLDQDAVTVYLESRDFDGIIHFAARAYVGESVEQPLLYWRSNVVPVINLCDGLNGVPFVFSSTCATFGNPQQPRLDEEHPQAPVNPYGNTKLAVEKLLADRAAAGQGEYAALRYFNACGASADGKHGEHHEPESHLIPLAIQAALGNGPELVVFGTDWDTADGTCIRDYIHVDDLASAHLLALERLQQGGSSGSWNLGTGSGVSVKEIIVAVSRGSGVEVPFCNGPRRVGDPASLVANPSLANSELGWQAQHTNIEEVIASAIKWQRDFPQGYSS